MKLLTISTTGGNTMIESKPNISQESHDKCQNCLCLKELIARMGDDRVTRIPDNISEEEFLALLYEAKHEY